MKIAPSKIGRVISPRPVVVAMIMTAISLRVLATANMFLRLMRSTKPPIGMAKKSHGNMLRAAMVEIQNGSLVKVVASSGAAVFRSPSARLLAALAVQSR